MKTVLFFGLVTLAVTAALTALTLVLRERGLWLLLSDKERTSRRRRLGWRGVLLFAVAIASLAAAFVISRYTS